MVLRSLFFVAALAASVVKSAPLKLEDRQAPSGVPDYVTKYAPIVWLNSAETYLPTDLQIFLNHVHPETNYQNVNGPNPLTVNNVDQLGSDIYLTSNDDETKNPSWMLGVKPDANGKTNGAISCAIIVTDHGNGLVDAFYMYFYGYNFGGYVLGWKSLNFDDHLGDWEHTMVRFQDGVPQAVWYSQHANGEAFVYNVVEKAADGIRPVAYSAVGSHANYAMSGTHDHTIPNLNLPFGALEDHCDKGMLWDPVQSGWFYKYDAGSNSFSAYDDSTPTAWLNFKGRWGDEQWPSSDKRQVVLFGQAKYSTGPTGPYDKQLNRQNVCPVDGQTCILRTILVPRSSDVYEVEEDME